MSARNRRPTIEHWAKLGAVVGLAVCIAAFAPASAWGGCGGGGGGGSHSAAPSGPPPAPQQNDPQKLKQLKYLTKKLKAELHLDNQKSKAVRDKEIAQTDEILHLLKELPDQSDPVVEEALKAFDDMGKIELKYSN